MNLQATSYGSFLQNESSPLAVSVIDEKLKEKLIQEFNHIRKQCVEPLSTFLDYITYPCQASRSLSFRYSYMIDNIILLITGTLHERDIHEVRTSDGLCVLRSSSWPSAILWECSRSLPRFQLPPHLRSSTTRSSSTRRSVCRHGVVLSVQRRFS